MYLASQILHLPTVKIHRHAVMTGSVKNSFGGLLRGVRHDVHKYMHEVLVDLLYMQRELHPAVFTVMDGTIASHGAGPRAMILRVKHLLLAATDSVAVDAVAAKLMGFDPLSVPFLGMARERGLAVADPRYIELVGDDVSREHFGFKTRRSLVTWGDQMIRKGFLSPLKRVPLRSPLMVWAPVASNVYHDAFWYPTIGRSRICSLMRTEWGQLFRKYRRSWNKNRNDDAAATNEPGGGRIARVGTSALSSPKLRRSPGATLWTSIRSCEIYAAGSLSARESTCRPRRSRTWPRGALSLSSTRGRSSRRC